MERDSAIGSPFAVLVFIVLRIGASPDRIGPIFMPQIPAYQRRQSRLELLDRAPTETLAQVRRVQSVAPIVARSISNILYQLFRRAGRAQEFGVDGAANAPHHIEIGSRILASDEIGPADLAVF